MSIFYRLLICCAVAIPASGFYNGYASGQGLFSFDVVAALVFTAVAFLSAVLCGLTGFGGATADGQSGAAKPRPAKSKAGGKRMQGEVKWFNGGKGFGFISADNGQEYFVHFRSVRKDSARL
ncbi:MAG: cold shock domain-containing protein, partial [Pseudomonadales bacterium]